MRRFIYYHLTRQDLLAIDKICQFVAFGDDVDLILLARELVSKQAARKMVLKIEVIPGASMLTDLRFRLRTIFRRRTVEQELAEELEFHLDRETGKYLKAGMSEPDARRQARIAEFD